MHHTRYWRAALLSVFVSAWSAPPLLGITFSLDPASPSALGETDIVALSSGYDPVDLFMMGEVEPLYFSVDRVAIGFPGTDVRSEASPPQESAHGDIYAWQPVGPHWLVKEEHQLGLVEGFFGDDIDGLIMDEHAGGFISHWRYSECIVPGVLEPCDITLGVCGGIYADGVDDIGLDSDDDLDALALLDVTPDPSQPEGFRREPNGQLDPGLDLAFFSLDPFSPTTGTGGAGPGAPGPADIFFTDFTGGWMIFAEAEALWLYEDDNIDALALVPEPASGLVMLLTLGFGTFRRRR